MVAAIPFPAPVDFITAIAVPRRVKHVNIVTVVVPREEAIKANNGVGRQRTIRAANAEGRIPPESLAGVTFELGL
jgi:hypothetical protein